VQRGIDPGINAILGLARRRDGLIDTRVKERCLRKGQGKSER
jgi:hypothetical protein